MREDLLLLFSVGYLFAIVMIVDCGDGREIELNSLQIVGIPELGIRVTIQLQN